ncbi:hypothetical protein FRC02_006411 [Tulasnella sp. 418]|nr:hypothetical protein FRC02_006411 [Tulasnella sp. 418]
MFSLFRTSCERDRTNSDLPPIYSYASAHTAASTVPRALCDPLRELGFASCPETDPPLPLYTNCPTSGEVILSGAPSPHHSQFTERRNEQHASETRFEYRSSRMKLDMGARGAPTTQYPAYGYGDRVEGSLEITSLKNVEKVELKFQGSIKLVATERGYEESAGSKILFSYSELVYSSETPASSSPTELHHHFSFTLPSQCMESPDLLPPSSLLLFPGIECHIAYDVKVDMFKKGFRKHETVGTRILYLPKTSPPAQRTEAHTYSPPSPSASSSNEKTDAANSGWKTSIMRGEVPLDTVKDLLVEMALPRPLSYKSKTPIPVHFLFSNSPDSTFPDLIASNATISLYKNTTLFHRGYAIHREQLLGKGDFGKAWKSHQESNTWTAEGSVVGGKTNGEISWQVDGFVSVEYAIRVEVKPSPALKGVIPSYSRTENITLTTHSWEEAFQRDGILDGPALGIIGQS